MVVFEDCRTDTIIGGRSVKGWAAGREIYFAMQFSKPFVSSRKLFPKKNAWSADVREAKGTSLKCLVHFQTAEGEAILVKTGISGVSAKRAQKNVAAEIPDWDFEKVRRAAHLAWRKNLSRIKVRPRMRDRRAFSIQRFIT